MMTSEFQMRQELNVMTSFEHLAALYPCIDNQITAECLQQNNDQYSNSMLTYYWYWEKDNVNGVRQFCACPGVWQKVPHGSLIGTKDECMHIKKATRTMVHRKC
jgi:hypothetical protein